MPNICIQAYHIHMPYNETLQNDHEKIARNQRCAQSSAPLPGPKSS